MRHDPLLATTKPAALDLDSFAGFTPGPWRVEAGTIWFSGHRAIGRTFESHEMGDEDRFKETRVNARLIAAAPALLAECKRLQAENERLREALEGAASGLDAMLNSADVVAASQEGDDALMQARAALEPQS